MARDGEMTWPLRSVSAIGLCEIATGRGVEAGRRKGYSSVLPQFRQNFAVVSTAAPQLAQNLIGWFEAGVIGTDPDGGGVYAPGVVCTGCSGMAKNEIAWNISATNITMNPNPTNITRPAPIR